MKVNAQRVLYNIDNIDTSINNADFGHPRSGR